VSGAAHRTERTFWPAAVIGFAIMGFGVRELWRFVPDADRRFAIITWIVGLDLAHDLLLAPLVVAVGLGLRRVVPGRAWAPLTFGLFTTAVVVAIAWAPLRGYGRVPDNPSIQPLDYSDTTTRALALVWLGTAVWIATSAARARSQRRSEAGQAGAQVPRGPAGIHDHVGARDRGRAVAEQEHH
jgi:hypothetical protein